MKLGILFSGGKDSSLAAWIARKEGYEVCCLISIGSRNQNSFMFHVPSIKNTEKQADVMGLPIIFRETVGEKEKELEDLRDAIVEAREKFGIGGIVTGAVESVYQATRAQKICDELGLEVFNPLWLKDQEEILRELVEEKFRVIVVGVAAYPLGQDFLGREIDLEFVEEVKRLGDKFGISVAGEGGEFESFVLDGPMFSSGLEVLGYEDFGKGNSWRREAEVE